MFVKDNYRDYAFFPNIMVVTLPGILEIVEHETFLGNTV